ncbi:D-amino-acid transaminase [Lentibacillus sp. Marseille-P4043]|uniref:D-amino-acid transaminase n=1 Tax=Lentibacillus sp. Marseille-P4043 TaxID=2040293 RepID=UPI000D0BBDEC|nr:D-amino-acid transaminase [Lentibacillus sp. Marseille-P4043]
MSIYPIILSQTKFAHRDSLQYPFEERGLQFGDGIYEVIRIYHGEYYLLEEHVSRLFRSAEAVKIQLPFEKEELKTLLNTLLTKNDVQTDAKVYLQVTRGSAPREHTFPVGVAANAYVYVKALPRNLEFLENGVGAITQRDVRWENCYIKSLNLLPNVMAKQEAKEHGCYEAILNRDGFVTECSSSNVYLVKNGEIFTHPATRNILHGCVRIRVEQFANRLGIPFNEDGFSVTDIETADELFLSSSTSEIMPIVTVDDKPVADGKPGKITQQLQEAYVIDANIETKKVEQTN